MSNEDDGYFEIGNKSEEELWREDMSRRGMTPAQMRAELEQELDGSENDEWVRYSIALLERMEHS
jgi:hypothetical protein